MRLKLLSRKLATTKALTSVFRNATAKDVDMFTRRAVADGVPIGPYDYPCAFAFDPKGFFVYEIDNELVNHICATRYPNHHSHIGGTIVTEKFRGKGYYKLGVQAMMEACDQKYTVGGDVIPQLKDTLISRYESKVWWDTYIAKLSLHKIAANLATLTVPEDLLVKSIRSIQLEDLLEYDRLVFGTDRRVFLEKWINAPGSFGWTALNVKRDEIVGYAVIRQIIRGGGTEIGMAVAPLYSDDVHIAKCLLKTAAEYCLANDAVPKTELEMFHPVGDNCGENASSLMKELEAELTFFYHRIYTKGIPLGRQTKKIYGIASPTFD